MKLDDLRKEAVSGIEPVRKYKKLPIPTKKGILSTSPDFDLSFHPVQCNCGASIGIKTGFSYCPVCGKDLSFHISKKTIVDFGISAEPFKRAVEISSLGIKQLAESIMNTYEFYRLIDDKITKIPQARLGLPEHFYSRCTRHYPVFDPTDARIADLQRHKITYANVCDEEPILSPLLLPDDNKGLK